MRAPAAALATLLAGAACGQPAPVAPARVVGAPAVPPRLPAPPRLDPSARGAAYLDAVALQLQPSWAQFLEDCRLRLPQAHALNAMSLAATIELIVDRDGGVTLGAVQSSGEPAFDRAAREVIADAAPLPAPPPELRSDDDRLHLRWLFARDRRQAGPVTAAIVDVELPLLDAIADAAVERAARRIARAPESDPARGPAATALATRVLDEALAGEFPVRRAAVRAIGRAHVTALAPAVRALLGQTSDAELRGAAVEAAAALGDTAAGDAILAAFAADLDADPRRVPAEAHALVTLGRGADAAALVARSLGGPAPAPAAIAALALVPGPARAAELAGWLGARDARVRAAACTALAGPGAPRALLVRGLRDRDATVRAACAAAAGAAGLPTAPGLAAALSERTRDRDDSVRAAAISALAALAPAQGPPAADDPAPSVRVAIAGALAKSHAPNAEWSLRLLAADRDADVRAAAFTALGERGPVPPEVAAAVPGDPAPRVRRAAAPGIADPVVLDELVADPDPQVASAALVRRAAQLGAAAALPALLARIAAAPPASAERVRAALAWLLAR